MCGRCCVKYGAIVRFLVEHRHHTSTISIDKGGRCGVRGVSFEYLVLHVVDVVWGQPHLQWLGAPRMPCWTMQALHPEWAHHNWREFPSRHV